MKFSTLLFALFILLAPIQALANGPKCEPPNPPDDYRPICPEFLWPEAYPNDYDPVGANPILYDPSQPAYSPPPQCTGDGLYGDCLNTYIPVITQGGFVTISVRGGVPPYTWAFEEQEGDAFTLEESITQGRSNVVHAAGNACGSAKITVTDSCPDGPRHIDGSVKSKVGSWVYQGGDGFKATGILDFFSAPPYVFKCESTEIVGDLKYYMYKQWNCTDGEVVNPDCHGDCTPSLPEGVVCRYDGPPYYMHPVLVSACNWWKWQCP